jgi:hypothetical protein
MCRDDFVVAEGIDRVLGSFDGVERGGKRLAPEVTLHISRDVVSRDATSPYNNLFTSRANHVTLNPPFVQSTLR